jgi:precorrin-2 dehydrogenase/sirohydrochlorin ferrochelatase
VRFIAGKGPSDLLTLRALRALGSADVLIADQGADPEVVTMARRDVNRLEPAEADAETLVTLAKEGKQIVRLIVAPVDPALVQALAAASVAVEVLMAAPAG